MIRSKKWVSLVLCLLIAVTTIMVYPHVASSEETENKETTINYVLILDCTQKAANVDEQEMRKAAAKMFVDLIPIDNANLAVFVIGAPDQEARKQNPDVSLVKSYKLRDVDNGHIHNGIYRMGCIYQIWDFDQSISTEEQRETLKKKIDVEYAGKNQGQYSDIHCGVYAALDTLKDWDSQNACILLVSDEFFAFYQGHIMTDNKGNFVESYDEKTKTGHTMWDDIANTLLDHPNWVLNWVDLGNADPANRKTVDNLCRINNGEMRHDFSISQLPKMIATVISKYGSTKDPDGGETITLGNSGSYRAELTDFIMLTEANIVVTGDGVEKVTVSDSKGAIIEKSNEEVWFSNNFDPENRAHFLYSAVKMIRPSSGQWYVDVKGKAGTQVYIQTITTLEPDVDLYCSEAIQEEISVGTKLHFTAKYSYDGKELHCGEKAYEHYLEGAVLTYTRGNDATTHPVKVYVDEEQYVADFVVQERGTYHFNFYVKSYDFKTVYRYANSIEVNVENHAPEAIGTIQDIGDVAVGSYLEGIFKITELFKDEDNEALKYHIECTRNGRDVEVKCDEIHDDGFLSLNVPGMAGVYDFKVYAEDSNGAQSKALTFSLNAVNKAPQLLQKTPMKVRMIADAPEWLVKLGLLPKDECKDFSILLGDLFTDPEGLPMEYQTDLSSTTDKEGNAIVSPAIDKETQTLTIKANTKGKATINVIATDSSNEMVTAELIINVRNTISVLFARYWWAMALILIILIIVAAALLNKKVRGNWTVTVNDQGAFYSGSIDSLTTQPELSKSKIPLLTAVQYILGVNGVNWNGNHLADVVTLHGTVFPGKCKVRVRGDVTVRDGNNNDIINSRKPFVMKAGRRVMFEYGNNITITVEFL